ncbi:MAG TPA: hypothetical protein VMU51_07175 [Mycobacteriales bacterium]|nr:hypothetical protein [Mycobacteriales bacterium]
MLTERRAARLVRWAGPGGWWPRGWWARRRLARAGGRGDHAAIDALWAVWLDRPVEAFWDMLVRWRRPAAGALGGASLAALGAGDADDPELVAAVVRAVGRSDHPIGETARQRVLAGLDQRLTNAVCAAAAAEPDGPVATFCREHRLVPADAATRAVYFLLTGQHAQRRAADPDGQLLAAGYAAATPDGQARLRAAMLGTADLDLVRVVAGQRRERVGRASTAEVAYLADQLRDRQAWGELWRLTTDASPLQALELVGMLPAGWRPAGDRARRLHAALVATPPAALSAATCTALPLGQIEVTGSVRDVAFAADGGRLAVVEHDGPWQQISLHENTPTWIGLYDVPTGQRRWRRQLDAPFAPFSRVLPVGDRVVACGGCRDVRNCRLDLISTSGQTTILPGLFYPTDPLPLPAGFALSALNRLVLGSGGGDLSRVVHWYDICPPEVTWSSLGTDAGSGRIAIGGRQLHILDEHLQLIATAQAYPPDSALDWVTRTAFVGADRLLTCGRSADAVIAWQIRQPAPPAPVELTATAELPYITTPQLTVFPAHRLVAVDWAWHHTDTLAPAAGPAGLEHTGRLVAAPTGEWAAVARAGTVSLYRFEPAAWIDDLAHRPAAASRPDDLDRVAAEQARAIRPDVRALLALLRACLEHRFGADIQLGRYAGPSIVDHDIAVADDPP